MSFAEVATLVTGICSIFVLVILFMQRNRNTLLENNFEKVWKALEKNENKIDETEKYIDRNFHSKKEVRDYIDLINAPYLKQMEHINGKLDELQVMVKELIDKKADKE